MEQLCEVRTRILLEKSADLQNRMAEIWALRKVVRPRQRFPALNRYALLSLRR